MHEHSCDERRNGRLSRIYSRGSRERILRPEQRRGQQGTASRSRLATQDERLLEGKAGESGESVLLHPKHHHQYQCSYWTRVDVLERWRKVNASDHSCDCDQRSNCHSEQDLWVNGNQNENEDGSPAPGRV